MKASWRLQPTLAKGWRKLKRKAPPLLTSASAQLLAGGFENTKLAANVNKVQRRFSNPALRKRR